MYNVFTCCRCYNWDGCVLFFVMLCRNFMGESQTANINFQTHKEWSMHYICSTSGCIKRITIIPNYIYCTEILFIFNDQMITINKKKCLIIILLKKKLCIQKNELNFHFVDTPKRPWRSLSQMQWSIMQGPIYWRGTPWGTSQYLLRFVSLC